jgi:hypothetical protein
MRLTLPTPLMLLTRHMLQADTKKQVAGTTTQVEFDASIQSLSALEAAAYRLIGTATCQIKRTDGRFDLSAILPCKAARQLTNVSLTVRTL